MDLFWVGGAVLTVPAKLLCGGMSGALAQCVSYPLDVTRRRMQLAKIDHTNGKFGWVNLHKIIVSY